MSESEGAIRPDRPLFRHVSRLLAEENAVPAVPVIA